LGHLGFKSCSGVSFILGPRGRNLGAERPDTRGQQAFTEATERFDISASISLGRSLKGCNALADGFLEILRLGPMGVSGELAHPLCHGRTKVRLIERPSRIDDDTQ
jgi:hypothetical protein